MKNEINMLGMLDSPGSLEIARRIYGIDGISPCLNAHASDTIPKILIGDKIWKDLNHINLDG